MDNSGRTSHRGKCKGIELNNNILKYNDKHGEVETFMYKEPMSARRHYFEIEILNTGQSGYIAIGLVPRNYPSGMQPGWAAYSVGYHADDGNLYKANGHGKRFGPTCQAGDKMGCGISFNNLHTGDLMSVFFTRNGVQIGSTSVQVPEGGFYPAVGMHSVGESVRLFVEQIFGQEFMESVNSGTTLQKSKCEGIKLNNNILKYNDQHGEVGTFMYKEPMSAKRHYFEIEILNTGQSGYIGIGLVPRNYPNGRMPGWNAYSVGYHADNGNLYEGFARGKRFGPTCKAGDKMGCGVSFNNLHTGDLMSVFFTRNGVQIGSTSVQIPEGGFYPAVGMKSVGESVRLFVEQIFGDQHSGVNCDVCDERDIEGVRWKCNECHNYDLCSTCYDENDGCTEHEYLRIKSPGDTPKRIAPRMRASTFDASPSHGDQHRAFCDACGEQDIEGVRWKCNECDDYDLCSTCYDENEGCTQHEYLRIRSPGDTPKRTAPRLMDSSFDESSSQVSPYGRAMTPLMYPIMMEPTVTQGNRKDLLAMLMAAASLDDSCNPEPTSSQAASRSSSTQPKPPSRPTTANASSERCPYFTKCKTVLQDMSLPEDFFDSAGDKCFCDSCMSRRGDSDVYKRGVPPESYVLPKGWVKFGLMLTPRVKSLGILDTWHVAFHGTPRDRVKAILDHEDLMIPGDVGLEDTRLTEREGHYNDKCKPDNFDTKQIFLSPSIKYSGVDCYAKPFNCRVAGRTMKGKVAFQLRIKPSTYKVGHETILRSHEKSRRLDPHIVNDKLEWSTNRRRVVQLTGLMVKVE